MQIDSLLCLTLPVCRDIFDRLCTIIFPPVDRSLTHTIAKKKKRKERRERRSGPICLFSVPHSSYLDPTLPASFPRSDPALIPTGSERETNKNALEEYTSSVWFGPLHHKGKSTAPFVSTVRGRGALLLLHRWT